MLGGIHGPWLLCAALLLLAVAGRRVRPPRHSTFPQAGSGERWWVGVITVGAVAARLVWGLWGPLHVNGQGPFWIRGAFEPALLVGYGPGYAELFGWLRYVGAPPDRAIFAANALLSGLSPALLFAAARLVGVGRVGALAAALVLAADAVTIRTAASEGYVAPIIALVLGVQVALALGVAAHARDDRLACGLAFVAAGLLAAAAARIHPVAYLPLALSPFVVFGAAQPDNWRTRIGLTLVAGATLGTIVLLSSDDAIFTALRAPMAGQASSGLAAQGLRQHATLLLGLLAVVWGLRRWLTPAWLPLLAIASVIVMLLTQNSFLEHPLQKLGYQRLFFPGILLGTAPLLWRLRNPAWALASAALIAGVLLVPARPHLDRPTTEQLEYRFLQETLRDMPPDCTLAAVSRAGKRVWDIPSYLVPSRGSLGAGAQRTVENASDVAAAGGCLLYVRSSLCSSVEARALCESVEREARLEPVASRVFPAAPSYTDLPYDRPEIEVVVFRVAGSQGTIERRQAAVNDGAAITPQFAQGLYDRVSALRESDGCHLVQFDTSRFRITLGLQTRSGAAHAFELATARPGASGRSAGGWALAVPAELERDCGATLAAIERRLAETAAP